MKQITKNTVLRCGDKAYHPVVVDGVICWLHNKTSCGPGDLYVNYATGLVSKCKESVRIGDKIVAQSQPKFDGIPVISLDNYVEKLAEREIYKENVLPTSNIYGQFRGYIQGYNANPNQYTQKDIEKAIELSRSSGKQISFATWFKYSNQEILEQINSISVIEVDEQFNILNYQ